MVSHEVDFWDIFVIQLSLPAMSMISHEISWWDISVIEMIQVKQLIQDNQVRLAFLWVDFRVIFDKTEEGEEGEEEGENTRDRSVPDGSDKNHNPRGHSVKELSCLACIEREARTGILVVWNLRSALLHCRNSCSCTGAVLHCTHSKRSMLALVY